MAASRPGDVLLLRGDGGESAWRETLPLQSGQRVVGSEGARLRPVAGIGVELADDVEVSGLAIEAAAGVGVVGLDVTGVRLADVAIQGSRGTGVLLERVSDVALAGLVVEESGGSGVLARDARDLVLTDCRVERAGDEDGEDAVRLVDPSGEVRLSRCLLSGGYEDLLDVHVAGGAVRLVVEDSELTAPGPGPQANDGILFRMTGGADSSLTADRCRFRGIAGNAIDAAGESAEGTLTVVVREADFADSRGSALSLSAGEDGSLDFEVRGSSFARLAAALELGADDRGRLTGTAAGNRMEDLANAVVAFADESTTARLELLDNRLAGTAGEAVTVFASGSASVDIKLAGNEMGGAPVALDAADEARLCLDLAAGSGAIYRLGGVPTARFELATAGGGEMDRAAAALEARLPEATFDWSGEPSVQGVASCAFSLLDEDSTGR